MQKVCKRILHIQNPGRVIAASDARTWSFFAFAKRGRGSGRSYGWVSGGAKVSVESLWVGF